MSKCVVKVWEDRVEIDVYPKPGTKTVWIAVGEYHGKRYESKGRTETAAAAAWCEQARYHTN
jgi:hypothetical protein